MGIKDLFASNEKQFWDWFEKNSHELFINNRQDAKIIKELSRNLKKINSGLTFEMSVTKGQEKKEFTISADGNPELIECVEKLYDQKPDLPNWEIKKFRQRISGFDIAMGDIKIKFDETKYSFIKDDDPSKISLLLFIKDFSEERRNDFGNTAYIFIDAIIGEYDLMKNIGFIEVFGYDSKYCENANPMREMVSEFDEIVKSLPK